MSEQEHAADLEQLMALGAEMVSDQSTAPPESKEIESSLASATMSEAEMAESMEQYAQERTRSSTTLEGLALERPHRLPKEATACEECPNAVWFATQDELKCYCRVMYLVTWSNREPQTIQLCDGQYIGQEVG